MQNDFIGGVLGTEEAKKIVPAVRELLASERASGSEIVFTQDTHGADYSRTQEGRLLPVPHCLAGTEGWKILSGLETDGATVFEKETFGSPALADYVRQGNYDVVTMCGVCTDICVASNAILIKAFCPETQVRVVQAACAGTTPQNHAAAIATMRSCQIVIE